ncbi:hypothetical protein MAR_025177 [Mya arenaria]|uniref:FAD dependent oxidoreductase domain-containing protein n=1 Tax=Mya arenaria TaxID=6604 RepID=A0ABY7DVY0_MYAAR|nr:uncharacterized protein LOC128228539 [Mya arenaria]WAR00805.1 hypothetical protein MAR_025177 [Mya arenaria]
MPEVFDFCIVGAGIVGSAAARHATCRPGTSVCLVGPTEAQTWSSRDGDVFGSWYDEGRRVSCLGKDAAMADIGRATIERFPDIEDQAGFKFYYEVGSLNIGQACVCFNGKRSQDSVRKLENADMKKQFPYLVMNKTDRGELETQNAGYINPRALVAAQKIIALRAGCTIIDDIAVSVDRVLAGTMYHMSVRTEGGRTILARRVLLATGGFSTFRDLLPPSAGYPDQYVKPTCVSLLKVSADTASRFRAMPCVLYKGEGDGRWMKATTDGTGRLIDFYMLPPIRYPDGCYYIKLGLTGAVPKMLRSQDDVRRWYRNGDVTVQRNVAEFAKSVFQGVDFLGCQGSGCVITETPTGRPYIDMVHDQLGVAFGGNGMAAKWSDEIGRLAFQMLLGDWDSHLPRDLFRLKLSHQRLARL